MGASITTHLGFGIFAWTGYPKPQAGGRAPKARGWAANLYVMPPRFRRPRSRTIVRSAGAFKIGTRRRRFLPRPRLSRKVRMLRHPFGKTIYKNFRR